MQTKADAALIERLKKSIEELEESRIKGYIQTTGDETFREDFLEELLMAEKIYQEIDEHGRVPGIYWQFFHDSYVAGQKRINRSEIYSTRPSALDIRKINQSITNYLSRGIQVLCRTLCENPIKDEKGRVLRLGEIYEKYPDVTRMLTYGIVFKYKVDLSVLRTRDRYYEYKDINSFFQLKELLDIIDPERMDRFLLYSDDVRGINRGHLEKMLIDRSYVILLPQWR